MFGGCFHSLIRPVTRHLHFHSEKSPRLPYTQIDLIPVPVLAHDDTELEGKQLVSHIGIETSQI